jgi:hypothetical protein
MPDISMCSNKSCKAKGSCYRFMAVPTPGRQCYGSFGNEDHSRCEYYVKVEKGDYIRKG